MITSGNFEKKTKMYYQVYLEQTGPLSKECTWIRYDIITNWTEKCWLPW